MLDERSIIDHFCRAMREKDIDVDPQDIIADGRLHRIHVNGDRNKAKSGWYVLHLTYSPVPAGAFGCNKRYGNETKFTWKADRSTKPLTADERKKFKEEMTRKRREREAIERAEYAQAAELANEIWNKAREATDHPYLTRKGIKSHGLRIGAWEKINTETGEIRLITKLALLIPIRDAKKNIHSLQAIFPNDNNPLNRDKDYLAHGKKHGMFYSIGKPQTVDGKQVIIICEGYATGASLHEATDHAVIVAFDAPNLIAVAKIIREKFPTATIIIAADNDRWTLKPIENPGVTRAREAATAINGLVAIPEFEDLSEKPTDFNDLHLLEGPAAVEACIENVVAEAGRLQPTLFIPALDLADIDRIQFAAELLAMFGDVRSAQLSRRGVLVVSYCGVDDLRAGLDSVRRFMPDAPIEVLAAWDLEQEIAAVTEMAGAHVRLPAGIASWADELWADLCALIGLTRLASGAKSVNGESTVFDSSASAGAGQHGAPRDEARRRLQKELNARLQDDDRSIAPPMMTVDEMLADCVWIASGSQVGTLSSPRATLTFPEFADLTASSVSPRVDNPTKTISNAVLWKRDVRRKTVHTRTFHAGAGEICRDPDGELALNSWRPIERRRASMGVEPFLDHIAYLIEDKVERERFLDWLAHIEQTPGVLPHYGWLHIAKNTGTGRNWVASVFARVWRGYVVPNVDLPALLENQFNGALAGRVLAMVDEVQEGGGDNPYRHANRLNAIVNAEERHVNPKFGRQFKEHNSCRWLVFSNYENALPLKGTDRRWRVVRHSAVARSPETYTQLYALLGDPEFINAVGAWLRERDISSFNPGERPPMNDAKRAALNASKSTVQQSAEDLVRRWPSDIITTGDATDVLSEGSEFKVSSAAVRRALIEAGAVQYKDGRAVKVSGKASKCWILRNADRWADASPLHVAAETAKARVIGGTPAMDVLAGVVSDEEPL